MTATTGNAVKMPSTPIRYECLLAALLAVIWSLALLSIVWPSLGLEAVSSTLLAVFALAAIISAPAAARVLVFGLLTGAIATAWIYDASHALWTGLERSVLFAAFLPSLSLVRGVARGEPLLALYRDRAEGAPKQSRSLWTLCGSYAVASFLALGASAIFASFQRDEAGEEARAEDARASVCGSSLAVLWSPFFVALAVVTEFIPGAGLLQVILAGFCIGAVGLIIASRVFGPREAVGNLVGPLQSLGLLALPVALVTSILALVRYIGNFSTIEAMLLVLPALCLLRATLRGRGVVAATARESWSALKRIRAEVAIITSAMIFGVVLTETPALREMMPMDAIAAAWPPALIAGCIAAMAAVASLGVHPLVTGTVALGVLTEAGPALSNLGLALTVLSGWSASSMLSMSSLMVLAAAAQYRVRPSSIVFGKSLLFFVLFLPVATAMIAGFEQLG